MNQPLVASIPTILALGSPHGDDQVAWNVADSLLQQPRFRGMCARLKTPWDVIPFFATTRKIIIIDACRSGSPAGTIHRLTARELPDIRGSSASTHGGSLVDALHLAESLGYDTSNVVIYAVESETCQPGAPLSESAHQAAEQLAVRIRRELTVEELAG